MPNGTSAVTLEDLAYELGELRRAVERNQPQNFTRAQAAEYLCISTRKLDLLVTAREVRSAKIGGSVRFKRAWLDDYLDAKAIGGPKPSRADEILAEGRDRDG